MKGYLIYKKSDAYKNTEYISMLLEAANEKNIDLILVFDHSSLSYDCDFVINRSRNLKVTKLYESNGVRVFNNSKICLLGNDKLAAYKYAEKKDIPYPKLFDNIDLNTEYIWKSRNGHGGKEVKKILGKNISKDSNYICQEYIEDVYGDVRFYIIGNKIVHSVIRTNEESFKKNYSNGAEADFFYPTDDQLNIVEKFIDDLDVSYAGIDFFITKGNEFIFNEIEDVVGSRMLSTLGINNTADLFIDYIKKTLIK